MVKIIRFNGNLFLRISNQIFIYSTVTNLSERVKLDLPEQILEFTITVSSNQLNQYNYNKQKRVLTKPVISSYKIDNDLIVSFVV